MNEEDEIGNKKDCNLESNIYNSNNPTPTSNNSIIGTFEGN